MYQFLTETDIMSKFCLGKKKYCISHSFKLPSKEVSNTEGSNNALKQKNVLIHNDTKVMDISQVLLSVTTKFILPDQLELIQHTALNTNIL